MRRTLYSPLTPPAPSATRNKLPTRILLIAALVVLVLQILLMYVPGHNVQLTRPWIYMIGLALVPMLLVITLTVRLYQGISSKWPRLIVTAVLAAIVLMIGTLAYSSCSLYATYGPNPVSFYKNKESGNRVVIMRCADIDTLDSADVYGDKLSYIYNAYVANGKYFYAMPLDEEGYPTNDITEGIHSKAGVDFVEWNEDGTEAAVHIKDTDGIDQVLTVSFE